MVSNQQVLVLPGEEKQKKRLKLSDAKSQPGDKEWDYVYKIEQWIKTKFNLGDYCYTWAVFDCCRSIFKDHDTLSTRELEEINNQDEEETKNPEDKEATRGEGDRKTGCNYLFINGCQANSVVKDKNPLV